MKKTILIILIVLPLFSLAQIPAEIRWKADSVLLEISQAKTLDGLFAYNCRSSATYIDHTLWHACDSLTRKQRSLFRKVNRHPDEKWYNLFYDCLLFDTIPGLVNIRIDTKGVPFYMSGIPDKENFHFLTDIQVDSARAVQLAIENGFQEGVAPWKVHLVFKKIDTAETKYYWEITNTLMVGAKSGCDADGKILVIDAISGKVVSEMDWTSLCVE